MPAGKKAAVALAWVVTVVAAFAVGRSNAPPARAPAPADLAAATEAAIGEPDVLERAKRIPQLMQHLDPDNVIAVAEVYDRLLNILGELSIRPFVAAWARFDPQAALRHTLRWGYRDKKEIGAGTAIETWALRDPAAARDAYEQLRERNPGIEEVLFFDLLTGWLYSGEPGVDDYIASQPAARLDTAISRVAAKTLRRGGPDALVAWVNAVTRHEAYENRFKTKAFQRGTRMVARLDPERAAAWALEHREQPYASDAPRIVAEQWGMQDGPAALEWVRNHPDAAVHHQAVREGFRTWYESDRASAVAWLEAERRTAFHDPAVLFYANDLSKRAPAEAIGWCERVADEKRRLGCLKRAATRWYKRDAEAAEAWLEQSPLDEAARSAVREPPSPRRRSPAGARRPGGRI